MKKQHISLLLILTFLFIAFTSGFFLGRNYQHAPIQVSVPKTMFTPAEQTTPIPEETDASTEPVSFPININSAGEAEFTALPGIGDILAQRILDYRQENGDFHRVEDLMNVEGIGEKRMEEILDYVTTGG